MQDSSNKEFTPDQIIQYSNYKDNVIKPNEKEKQVSNASKEEYSIINLALMLSHEKKINDLITNIKNELQDNIETSRDVLEINIKDTNKTESRKLKVPYDDNFVPDKDDSSGTNKHYDYKV